MPVRKPARCANRIGRRPSPFSQIALCIGSRSHPQSFPPRHIPFAKMASAFTPRQAWVSTGIRLQTAASQRPPCISNVRSTLRHRNLSVSPIKHEESNQGWRSLRSNQDVSVQEPSREVDEVNVAVSAGKSEEGKPPKPHSLKDIFPDLFGDRKPLMAQ